MKLTALCCTFRRPHSLGELIESFLDRITRVNCES